MKKYATKLSKEITELKGKLAVAVERVGKIEKAVIGEERSYGMNNEEIERKSLAGSAYEG